MNDQLTLLRRIAALEEALDRSGEGMTGAGTIVCQTTSLGSYPTAATAFYAVFPVAAGGAEVEGGAVTLNPESIPFYAYNIGSKVPPPGTNVLAHAVPNRWVFSWNG